MLPAEKRKRAGLRLLYGLLGFFAVIIASWAGYLGYLANVENGLRAECRERKEPLTFTEVAALYPEFKDEENAAVALMELWTEEDPTFPMRMRHALENEGQFINEIPPELGKPADWFTREEITDDDWKLLDEYLENFAGKRPRLLAALNRPSSRFPVVMTDHWGMQMPHVPMIRLECNRLAFDFVRALHRNEPDRAVADVVAIARFARHIGQEPLTISQLVSCGLYQQAVDLTAQLLSHHDLTAAQLAQLRPVGEWYSFSRGLAQSVLYERVAMLGLYNLLAKQLQQFVDPDGHESDAAGYQMMLQFARISGGKSADCIHMLRSFRAATELMKEPAPGIHDRWEQIFGSKSWGFPPKIFSRLALSPFGRVIYRHLNAETGRRSLQAALAIEEFRVKTGKLPDTLAEIQAAHPELVLQDPYAEGQLRFRKLDKGYAIYSVGHDGKDDDAQASSSQGKKYDGGDIVFAVRR